MKTSILRVFRRRKKMSIVLSILLVGVAVWVALLLSATPSQLYAYSNFISWGGILLVITFVISLVAAAPKREKMILRYEGPSAEIHIKPHERRRISRRVVKWVLISGAVVTLFGIASGIISQDLGFCTIGIGGMILGVGVGLLPRMRH